jgi:hypothetical protein
MEADRSGAPIDEGSGADNATDDAAIRIDGVKKHTVKMRMHSLLSTVSLYL